MSTYFYIDESFRSSQHTLHAAVGGALVENEKAVDIEIALNQAIGECTGSNDNVPINEEFKFASFFEQASDDFKYRTCGAIARVLSHHDVRFLVSHAFIRKHKLKGLQHSFQSDQLAMQYLAFSNISTFLQEETRKGLVQMFVDLGLSKSFRPVYTMYTSGLKTIPHLLAMGISESNITAPHFRNLPTPAFIASEDSRLIQISDLVVGLVLARETGQLSSFKSRLLEELDSVSSAISLQTVEWNANEE